MAGKIDIRTEFITVGRDLSGGDLKYRSGQFVTLPQLINGGSTIPSQPIPLALQAAIIGPLLYAPDTEMGRKNPGRVAQFLPHNFAETMRQAEQCVDRGATSIHIHPIETGTGNHHKSAQLYAKNAQGVRKRVPRIIVNNDASLNSISLSKRCTGDEYLRTRLAGLDNPHPPDVFTLFATNEALLVAETNGGFPRPYVETFILSAGIALQRNAIIALAEISQEPYGMRSVRYGLDLLKRHDIQLPGLSFSFLVNGTNSLPAYSDRILSYSNGDATFEETPKERLMRIVGEALQIKDDFKLAGPMVFGTVVRASDAKRDLRTGKVLQHDVWDWVADIATHYRNKMCQYGMVIKVGLEEWASYNGQQISNPDAVTIARYHMGGKKVGSDPIFHIETDINAVRNWSVQTKNQSIALARA